MEEQKEHFIHLRSEDIQEIISHKPHWIVRWGSFLMLLLGIGLGVGSWFIHYPEIIKAPFKLSSLDAPKPVIAKSNGILSGLFTQENAFVSEGQTLAYIENTSELEQVMALSSDIATIYEPATKGDFQKSVSLLSKNYRNLGEVQAAYQTFAQINVALHSLMSKGYGNKKKNLLQQEIANLQEMKGKLKEQWMIQLRDQNLAENDFRVQRKLANEGVIAPLQLNAEESKVLAKRMPVKITESEMVSNASLQSAKQKEILEIDKSLFEQQSTFLQALNTLKSTIATWEDKYVLKAPASGQIYLANRVQAKQSVSAGMEVFFIGNPTGKQVGEIRIAQNNFGKVKKGQEVIIKFDAYPFEEYGSVSGKIEDIAEISNKENSYLVQVSLPNGLHTSYKKQIKSRTGMTATAEIITEDLRLIERLFYQLRKTLKQ